MNTERPKPKMRRFLAALASLALLTGCSINSNRKSSKESEAPFRSDVPPISIDGDDPVDMSSNSESSEPVLHAHTYASEWESDDEYHWHPSTCGCGVTKDKERHNFVETVVGSTYEERGRTTCACKCGYSYTKSETEQLAEVYSYGLEFSLSFDDTYSVCGIGTETSGNISIPSKINGIPVTSVEEYAFDGCDSITSLVIPGSITTIEQFAFRGRSSLTSVVFLPGLESIGWGAFASCSSLTRVEIPNTVTYIGYAVFVKCSSLVDVSLPDTLTFIASSAFSYEDNVKYATYNGCKYLGSKANPYAVLMETPSKDITSLSIHASTKIIACGVFYSCRSLTSVVIPNSVTTICTEAFYDCSSLTSLSLGSGLKFIGSFAFSDCSSLTSICLGSGLKSIGFSAFKNCSSLSLIIMPSSIATIDTSAFEGCSSIEHIFYEGNQRQFSMVKGVARSSLDTSKVYFYQETEPTDEGQYWHYVNGAPTVWVSRGGQAS